MKPPWANLVAAGEGVLNVEHEAPTAPSPLRLSSPKKIGLAKSRSSPARGEEAQTPRDHTWANLLLELIAKRNILIREGQGDG